MNYYSRNSPAKRKINPPPGFLIPDKSPYSSRKSSRAAIKSHFNLSARHSASASQFDSGEKCQQILVLEDDVLYVPTGDQILIQQEQQLANTLNQNKNKNANEQIKVYQLSQNNQIIDQNAISEQGGEKSKSNETLQVAKFQKIEQQNEDKYFFRNYSFGDKQFFTNQTDTQNKKEPFIRKLFNSEFGKSIQLQARARLSRNNAAKIKQQGLRPRIEAEQSWSKVVKNFIKKRSNSESNSKGNGNEIQHQEQDDSPIQINVKKIQQTKQPQNRQSQEHQIEHLSEKQNGNQSQNQSSGYFTQTEANEINQSQKLKLSTPQKDLQIRIQQQEPEEEQNIQQQLQQGMKLQQHSSFAFKSAQLLSQAILELPEQLIPTYLRIEAELQRRQHDASITIRRMKQTQQMIQLLIKAQKCQLYVDSYILEEERSQTQEKITANRQIIFGLVRKLALFF